MERKNFLSAALGAAAAVIGAGAIANAGTQPVVGAVTSPVPLPSSNQPGWRRGQGASGHNIHMIRRHLDRVIDELQHDQNDYGGHRAKAITFLQQARVELLDAEQYDTQHPGSSPTAQPQ